MQMLKFNSESDKCFIWLLYLNDLGEMFRCYSNQWTAQEPDGKPLPTEQSWIRIELRNVSGVDLDF